MSDALRPVQTTPQSQMPRPTSKLGRTFKQLLRLPSRSRANDTFASPTALHAGATSLALQSAQPRAGLQTPAYFSPIERAFGTMPRVPAV